MERSDAVEAIQTKTGKTAEQAEAFLDILGSAFRRRGWAEGEPLSQSMVEQHLSTFLSDPHT